MICQFSVTNYKCFKDEITLDLQATNIQEHENSLLVDRDGEVFLPLCVIYGPNGSGKSTILEALYSLACKIMRPICAVTCAQKDCLRLSSESSIEPFKFSSSTIKRPTKFELFFRTKTNEYQYQLSVLKNKVVDEQLYKKALSGARYSKVFSRSGSSVISKGSIKNYETTDLSDELTFLSYLGITHRRNKIVLDIINWFDNQFNYINYGNPLRDASIAISEADKIKKRIINMLAEMDIDIVDYNVIKKEEETKIYTYHKIAEKQFKLELGEESSGTIKVFGLLPYIAQSLELGETLVIDELDAKIHPSLLKYIINLYSDRNINRANAQLLFTSHDLSTMNNDTFRRDEIWFVAKGENLSSKAYSLIEFKNEDGKHPRNDERYDKRYIEGRYGADPYLKKIIDWEV